MNQSKQRNTIVISNNTKISLPMNTQKKSFKVKLPHLKTLQNQKNQIQRVNTNMTEFNDDWFGQASNIKFEDQQFDENIKHKSQKYSSLWNQISKIQDLNIRQQYSARKKKSELIEKILEQKKKRLQLNLKPIEQQLKQLYKQSHKLYNELNQIKESLKQQKIQKQKEQNNKLKKMQFDFPKNEKVINQQKIISNKVDCIKISIRQKNEQLKQQKKLYKQAKNELIAYLKQALHHGLDYRQFGLSWIIKKLINLNQTVNISDLPDILDKQTRQFLINSSISNLQRQALKKKLLSRTRQKKSNSLLQIIQNQQLTLYQNNKMKNIYIKTKNYLNNFIRNNNQRVESRFNQDKKAIQHIKNQQDNSYAEYRRIKQKYPNEIQQVVKKMVFGIFIPKSQKHQI